MVVCAFVAACAAKPPPDDPSDEVPFEDDAPGAAEAVADGDEDFVLPAIGPLNKVSSMDRAAARQLAMEGTRKLDAGDAAGALPLFLRSYEHVQVPTLLVMIAKAQLALGRKAHAKIALEQAVYFPAQPDEPSVFGAARQEARALLGGLR